MIYIAVSVVDINNKIIINFYSYPIVLFRKLWIHTPPMEMFFPLQILVKLYRFPWKI